MLLQNKPSWYLPESQASDEKIFLNRRTFAKGLVASSLIAPLGAIADESYTNATKKYYPAKENPNFLLEKTQRKILTKELDFASYNNFYEFGSHKSIAAASQKMKAHPWEIEISVEGGAKKTFAIEDIIKKIGLETRVYRFRCVETWAMTVPWVGFPLNKLLALFEGNANTKLVSFLTATQPDAMPGLKEPWYPWPYRENLELAEAKNDLAFVAVGAYDKPLGNQNGAPLRLVLPWKYGFKNIKSINKIIFTDTHKKSFWEEVQGSEYGFYANINPKVSHKRWSQANEKLLGSGESQPTLLYNGYEEHVASLYKDKPQDILFF